MPGYKDELPFAFRAAVAYPQLHIKLRNRALVLDERQPARS
jgi:hypothetical protein